MLQSLKLLLPALIPSWRFFDVIAPSPRIEFTLPETPQSTAENWYEFRPRPAHLSFKSMLKRMCWNPSWNESLFMVSCAERLMTHPTHHSRNEIFTRIQAELERNGDAWKYPYMQFRLVFLSREGTEVVKNVTYVSAVYNWKAAHS